MEFTIVNNTTNESSKQVHYNNDYNKLIDIFNNNSISKKQIEKIYLESGNNFENSLEQLLDISSKLALVKSEIDKDKNNKDNTTNLKQAINTNEEKDDSVFMRNNISSSVLNSDNNNVRKKKKKKKKKKKTNSNPRYMRINSPERAKQRTPYIVLSPDQMKQKRREEQLKQLEIKRLEEVERKRKEDEDALASALAELTKDEGNLIVLSEVFPDIPIRVLKSLLRHCDGNVDKTMERIITMFEDGVFNNHSNLIVNNDNNNSVDTKTNALDLFAPEEEEEEEEEEEGDESPSNNINRQKYKQVKHATRQKISPKLKRICKSFPDAHPFFVHSLLKNFNNNILDVEDGLIAFNFKKVHDDPVKIFKKNKANVVNTRLSKRLEKIKVGKFHNKNYNNSSNNNHQTMSFRDTLVKGGGGIVINSGKKKKKKISTITNALNDKLKQIDNNTETNHHHHHHNNNDDTLLTNLDGGFTIVKNKKKNRRDKQVSNTASNNDGMEQVQSKNKHNWLYARAMMLSKFQKAASIYKSNPARARMLADEGEQYRFMALQYRIEEADRIFYENNNELFQLNKNHLATYIKEPPVTKINSGANITPIQIDLHGLHVTEGIYQVKCAIEMCEEHAAASTQIICSSSSKRKNKYTQKLIIVTGHGENRNNKTLTNTPSRSGKLYKNVRQFLKRKGMNFVEQKGSFEVLM